jgi:tetratricopeptide (TPR) repeat protein
MGAFVFRLFSRLMLIASLGLVSAISLAADDPQAASETAMTEGKVAFDSKMYDYSKSYFEKALELNRSNYDAMLYLAKAYMLTDTPKEARKHAEALASSFYPSKKLKIEAFQVLRDIENKYGNPWLALSYIYASSQLSTNVDISHLVDEQMASLDFGSLSYPDFNKDADGVMTSPTLSFVNGSFEVQSSKGAFEQVSYSVGALKTKFVVLPGFDERNRFTKLLLIRIQGNLKPKLEEILIQGRKRGGILGANDLFLKIMDWNFDTFPDLVVRVSPKRQDAKEAFLLFNAKNERFELNEDLSALNQPILDRKTKAVRKQYLKKNVAKGKMLFVVESATNCLMVATHLLNLKRIAAIKPVFIPRRK